MKLYTKFTVIMILDEIWSSHAKKLCVERAVHRSTQNPSIEPPFR